MRADEQVRALTGVTVEQVGDDVLTLLLALKGVTPDSQGVPSWTLLRVGADLLTRRATDLATTPQLASSEDLTISTPKPSDLLAVAARMRTQADEDEEDVDGALTVMEFKPWG